jgi:TRAP-type C4-dicarboxylate transport system substrate-binding protein
MANFFKPEVDRLLKEGGNKYRINWHEAYSGTLFKLQDTMEAIRDYLADIGFVGSLWESDTMPLSNITYFAPFASGDMALVLKVVDKIVRENPGVRKEREGNNLKYPGAIGIDTYHAWSKTPLTRFEDLKGRRYNVTGAAQQWMRNTGGVAVDGGLPTYYTNVQAGVTDGALSFYTGIAPIRLHEMAPHITEIDMGSMFAGAVAMTLDRFNKLPKEVQEACVKAGEAYRTKLV